MRQVRSITATLAVLCAFLSVSAAGAAQGAARPEPDPASQGVTTGVTTVRELPELRTATSDTFLQSDGSRLLSISNHPINYQQNGAWRPIEDRLVEAAGGAWEPVASPVPVSLPVGLAGRAVRIGAPGRQISLTLQDAEGVSGVASGNERSYGGVMKGVDVSYSTTPQSVRETVTLASASAPNEYKYSLGLAEGLHASLGRGGSVTISDSNGNTVSTIAAPTISDSSGERMPSTAPVHYELNGAGTVLTLVVDQSWLSSPSRVFPVRIDPDVYFGAVKDCTIATGSYENRELCGGSLFLGHGESGTSRLLLNYDLSSIPRGSQILSSSIGMWLRATSTSSPLEVEAYGLSRGFTSHVTWNKYDGEHPWSTAGGDHLKTLAGSTVIKHEYVGGWVSIGFSPQVEQWVRDPTSNLGILLKAHNETENNLDEFNQSGSGTGEGEPNIHIVYEPTMGNPPNEAMFQEPIGNGGTLGVNVANGNLHITNPDVNYATEGYTTQVARSYNSYEDTLVSSGFGGGWRLNMGQDELLYPAWWDGSNAFHEPDGSYTRFDRASWADNHPNPGDKAYTGDAYRGETLIKHENGSRTLTYNGSGVEWQFDSSENGFPQKIVDTGGEGNTVAMSYTESRLTKVTDTHGHALTLTYVAGTHHVAKLKGTVTGEEWVYTYNSEGYLTKYKGPGGQEATYTYTKLHKLESIADPTGTVVVAYYTSGRVASLRKLINGTIKTPGTEDEITSFAYETEHTTVAHPTGGKDVYNYDEFGNIVEEPATQEAASEFYASYAEIEPEAAKKAVDLQDHAGILDSQLSQQLGDSYVGEWFNPVTRKVVIGITATGYEQTVERDLDNLGLADNGEIVTEMVSGHTLEERETQLATELSSLVEGGLATIGTELSSDKVTLEIANSLTSGQKAAVARAVEKAGATVRLVEAPYASVAAENTSCSRGNCTAPLRGGVAIAAPETFPLATCTAGFVTRSRSNGKPYLLTAGHCLKYGGGNGKRWAAEFPGDVLAFNETIGNSYSWVDGANGDAGLIEIAPSGVFGTQIAPYIITYGNSAFGTARNERYMITKPHYSPKGHESKEQFVVCLSGTSEQAQYARCGFTKGYQYEVPIAGGGPVVHDLERFWQCHGSVVTSGAPKGTSGSPIYKNHEALGVYVASDKRTNGCLGYYEGINTAERVLNVAVVTG